MKDSIATMIRPQKNFTNRLINQWEQNLLLKVMERKIKTAKSTIPATRKLQHQSSPAILKPSNTCNLEWDFSNLKSRLSNSKVTVSLSPRQLKRRDITAKLNDKNPKKLISSPTKPEKTRRVMSHELKDVEEDEKSSSLSRTDVESVSSDISDGFIRNEFEDTDDDLLSQLWNSCKKEDALLEDAALTKPEKVGSVTTAVIYVNKSNVPTKIKQSSCKENRLSKTLILVKKSKVQKTKLLSRFMKKREEGWRE